MKRKFFKSFGFYLLLYSLFISIIPITLVQLASHRRAKRGLEDNLKTKIETTSKTAQTIFSARLTQEKEGLEIFARISPLKKEIISDYFFVYRKNFARISVLDSEGKALYSLVPNSALSTPLPKPYEERLDLQGISPETAAQTRKTASLGLFPVADGYAERILVKTENGFILSDIRLSSIFSDIVRDLNLKSNEELVVLDQENTVIYANNPTYLSQKIELESGQKFIPHGKNSLLGFAEAGGPFRFGLRVDYDSLLESITRSLQFGLSLTIILALAILLLITLSLRWLSRPMSSLIKGAEQIANGNFNQQIRIRHPEELKILAARFNEMAESLKSLIREKTQSESFAAIGKFASYFAHDIKSPLEGTYLISCEMSKSLSPNDPMKEYLDEVIIGIERMRSLVKGALDFSKAANPKLEPRNLNLIIEAAAAKFQEAYPCQISLQLAPEIPLVLLDFVLIQRVFQNLFQNSFEARSDECQISVRTERMDERVLIEVEDNGKGIDAEIFPSIFEPFKSTKEKGYGFGLAFVWEVIRSHQGQIHAESEPGKGAKFKISIPLKKIHK